MPKAYILVGPPCSGKSTWARELCFCRPNTYIISRDDIRVQMNPGKYIFNKKKEEEVSKEFDARLRVYIHLQFNVILDNTHCKQGYIDEQIKKFPENYEVEIKYFPIPLWKAYYRNVVRYLQTGKWIPFKVIRAMKKNFDKLKKNG